MKIHMKIKHNCKKCGYEWEGGDSPKCCPYCKTYKWREVGAIVVEGLSVKAAVETRKPYSPREVKRDAKGNCVRCGLIMCRCEG